MINFQVIKIWLLFMLYVRSVYVVGILLLLGEEGGKQIYVIDEMNIIVLINRFVFENIIKVMCLYYEEKF